MTNAVFSFIKSSIYKENLYDLKHIGGIMVEDNYKILKCFHCGNEGMLKIEHIYEHCFGGPVFDDIILIKKVKR